MTANIYGSNKTNIKAEFDKKYINSKFIMLGKELSLKLNTSGGTVSGNISMNHNLITDLDTPLRPTDAANRGYVDSEFLKKSGGILDGSLDLKNNKITSSYIPTNAYDLTNKNYVDDSLLLMNRKFDEDDDLDMKWYNINNVKLPMDELDAVNRLYVEMRQSTDNITVDSLQKIGKVIIDMLNEHIEYSDYKSSHRQAYDYVYFLTAKYNIIFENNLNKYLDDLKNSYLFTDLKAVTVLFIIKLPKDIFLILKRLLLEKKLIVTPEDNSIGKRYRKVINKLSTSDRENEHLELLIQKNILLLDLGFVYFIEALIKRLAI